MTIDLDALKAAGENSQERSEAMLAAHQAQERSSLAVRIAKHALIAGHCRGVIPHRVVEAAFARWPALKEA